MKMDQAERDEFDRRNGLPTDAQTQRSQEAHCDTFFKVPEVIQAWMDESSKSLPEGWRIAPWTINRVVTVFNSKGEVHHLYAYEVIEDGMKFVIRNDNMY